VDFRNAVVIMTSNIGSQDIAELGSDYEKMRKRVLESLRDKFRPEFLNRIDEIIIFRNLAREDLKLIVDIQAKLLQRRLQEKGLAVELSPEVKEYLAERGFDPVYGARPLKRVIEKSIYDVLAQRILEGDFAEGDMIAIGLDRRKGELTFTRRQKQGTITYLSDKSR
jgi:ATP-dependent Clp protease ATP-binding subunit ClpB